MKHFILLFFATTLLCQGQIIDFPDSNFKNALVNHSPVIDTNGDGEVQVSEANIFLGTLFLGSSYISDLSGIEYFINITKIYAYDNALTQIDLSNNTNLTYVDFERNFLTSIDLSNNINLTFIDVGLNNLSSIDLTNNVNLTFIILPANNLANLSLSNNLALKVLEIGHNQLGSIDLSNNINIEQLSINNNNLTELDLSNHNKIFRLECSRNQLVTLNLPISNSLLLSISCTENQLGTLDLTNQAILEYLNVGDNQLANLDLTSQNSLRSLRINNNALNDLNLASLIILNSLDCSNNNLTSLDIINSPNINNIKCQNNQLTDLNINSDSTIQYVDCSNNFLSTLTINAPSEDYWSVLLCSGNLLTNLDLSNTNVGQIDCSDNLDLENINWRSGWNYKFFHIYGTQTRFQNLPNLSSVCIDSYNQELMDFILTEVGHSVDFYNNETCDALSVNENNFGELTITPNPAENSINIKANTQINQIEIYNEVGQLVQSNALTISTRQTDLDISALGQGLYFVKVADENGNATIKKVIKE